MLWNGVTLSPLEYEILTALIEALPPELREIVVAQFESYNLVQREIDGRALNFYRRRGGGVTNLDGIPLLEQRRTEAPLVRLSATLAEEPEPIHAVLTAVGGRAFCVSLNRAIRDRAFCGPLRVIEVTPSWRSEFGVADGAA
jgi:hypothetical protein